MALTTAGFAMLIFVVMLFMGSVGRLGMIIILIIGAILPLAASMASGVQTFGSAIAPVFNSLGGGLG